jgi:hypothetical protein
MPRAASLPCAGRRAEARQHRLGRVLETHRSPGRSAVRTSDRKELLDLELRVAGGGSGAPPHASGAVSHASGSDPHASGADPHASGADPHASGADPHASGADPHASGTVPHASGAVPQASGAVPHASGSAPHASGAIPHASGTIPHASGKPPDASTPPPEASALPDASTSRIQRSGTPPLVWHADLAETLIARHSRVGAAQLHDRKCPEWTSLALPWRCGIDYGTTARTNN